MPKKILIAEDEKPMARALELKLNNAGFEAKAVYNGQEALDILEKEPYDILLMDLIMPKVDGFKVLETLKQRGSKMPVIVLSNLSQDEDKTRIAKYNVVDYFVKADIPINKVVERVQQVLGT